VAAATAASRAAGRPVVAYDLSNLPEAFAFYGDGLYTVETKDLEILARHLRRPETVWAVVRRPGLDRLPADVRERLVVVAEDRLSRRAVVLVNNRGGERRDRRAPPPPKDPAPRRIPDG
jgi:hypothetical protein